MNSYLSRCNLETATSKTKPVGLNISSLRGDSRMFTVAVSVMYACYLLWKTLEHYIFSLMGGLAR